MKALSSAVCACACSIVLVVVVASSAHADDTGSDASSTPASQRLSKFWTRVSATCDAVADVRELANELGFAPGAVTFDLDTHISDETNATALFGHCENDSVLGFAASEAESERQAILERLHTFVFEVRGDLTRRSDAKQIWLDIDGQKSGGKTEQLAYLKAIARGDSLPPEVPADLAATLKSIQQKADKAAEAPALTRAEVVISGGTSGIIDNVLRGVGSFLIKRARAEFQLYVIEEIRGIAKCDKLKDGTEVEKAVATLFESSCLFLGSGDATFATTFGPALRTAFTLDMLAFPKRIVALLADEGGIEELRFRIVLETAVAFYRAVNPRLLAERMRTLATTYTCSGDDSAKCEEASVQLRIAAEIMLVIFEDGSDIADNPEQYALRIVKQLANDAPPEISQTLEKISEAVTAGTLEADLREVMTASKNVYSSLRVFAEADDIEQKIAALPLIVDGAIVVANAALRLSAFGRCLVDPSKSSPSDCDKADQLELPDGMSSVLDAMARGDTAKLLGVVMAMARRALSSERFDQFLSPNVRRVLAFAAEIGGARDEKAVEAAIESIAAPVGAWKMKRKRSMVSLGGIVGLTGGLELLTGSRVDNTEPASSLGLMAALGFDLSYPCGSWTLGAFVSIIDLGPYTSLRADNRSVEGGSVDATTPLSFKQVFAPGVYFRFGIGNSPIVAGIGASIVPEGRRFEHSTDETMSGNISTVRFMGFLAIDVTILPF